MTTNQSVATALLTVGILFLGAVPTIFSTNWVEAVVLTVVGVAVLGVREVLP